CDREALGGIKKATSSALAGKIRLSTERKRRTAIPVCPIVVTACSQVIFGPLVGIPTKRE
ncbi:MAG TPA: hypothetical protein VNB49_13140, partial [Candidatus Dormibacteraeota bacterium]|nr:hypothetical protein [Candidatus Dormibacteraeota bacterium]